MQVQSLSLAAILLVPLASPAWAHHSHGAYVAGPNATHLEGTVKEVQLINPHSWIYLEVKNEKGVAVEWEVEMMSLNHLRGYGWTSKTVKPGDTISCTGSPAKSGAPSMISNRMKLADGRDIRS